MSLKIFHIFFIISSLAVMAAFGVMEWSSYLVVRQPVHLLQAGVAWVGVCALFVYGFKVLRKFQEIH